MYENLAYIELIRRGREVYYWKGEYDNEVDFLLRNNTQVDELIKVCYNLDDEKTKSREVNALVKALTEFKLKKGLIITSDYEGSEKIDGKKIKYIPLWRWLLS